MKNILTFALALITVAFLSVPSAEAKRMGGGANLGRQTTMPRQAPPPAATPAQTQVQRPSTAQPAAGGASRWLGPLAGLAAGGLLAALFFGGAFDGLAPMDFLLIIALAVGGFFLIRAMRRRAPAPVPVTSAGRMAGYGATGGFAPEERESVLPTAGATPSQAPAWFDGPAFAEGAKSHFIRLQAAWDQADWDDLRTYTTPELLAELQREHARSATPGQYTEVVRLNAELLEVQRDGDQVVASVRFSGLIREEADGPAQPFDEVWHVQHVWATREGDWLISGIQQVGA